MPDNQRKPLSDQKCGIYCRFSRLKVFTFNSLYLLIPALDMRESLPYINLACLSVCLYPINVKTAEPIGPKC